METNRIGLSNYKESFSLGLRRKDTERQRNQRTRHSEETCCRTVVPCKFNQHKLDQSTTAILAHTHERPTNKGGLLLELQS